ncbi:MAG: SGNH/GDSL hydrolase family protein [Acidobacteria bacterium]|nr:SGNH/GDSL hydrolase family protein [Acidobacteriota bacterium]
MSPANARSWPCNLGLAAASFLIVLLIFEAALRIAGFSYTSFFEVDPYVGWKLRPGSEGWNRSEGMAYVKINSAGLRDREHTKAKPPNTFRIAVLGDSMAEARQVPIEKTFWSILERKLAACDTFHGTTVEVINFGVSGYGTGEELHMLREEVWDYSPDLVLLAFTTANDISDNSRKLDAGNIAPHYYFRDGQLALDDSFKRSRGFAVKSGAAWRFFIRLSDELRTVQLLNKAKNSLTLAHPATRTKRQDAEYERGLYHEVYLEPVDPDWREAWEVTEQLIQTMRQEVEAKGARFLLVTLSTGIQVDPRARVRENFMRQLGVQDLFYPDRRIQAFAQSNKIDTEILAPQMLRYAEAHNDYLHGFPNARMGVGHWNEDGHRVAGELIAEHYCSQSKH